MIIPKYIIDKKKTKKEWKDYFISELTIHSTNNQIYNNKEEAICHRKVFTQLKKEKSTQLSITAVKTKKFDSISTQNEITLNFLNTKKYPLNISQFHFEITHPKPGSKPNHKSIKHKLYENIYKHYNDKTIKASIISVQSDNQYTASYNGGKIAAYSNNSEKYNQNVPKGNARTHCTQRKERLCLGACPCPHGLYGFACGNTCHNGSNAVAPKPSEP